MIERKKKRSEHFLKKKTISYSNSFLSSERRSKDIYIDK